MLTHGGPFGVVGGLLFWIAYKGVPRIHDAFRENTEMFKGLIKAREEQFKEERREDHEYETARTDKLAAALSQLAAAHTAQAEAVKQLAETVEQLKQTRPGKPKSSEGGDAPPPAFR